MFKRLIAFALAAALCGASASVLAQIHGGGHSGGGDDARGGGAGAVGAGQGGGPGDPPNRGGGGDGVAGHDDDGGQVQTESEVCEHDGSARARPLHVEIDHLPHRHNSEKHPETACGQSQPAGCGRPQKLDVLGAGQVDHPTQHAGNYRSDLPNDHVCSFR